MEFAIKLTRMQIAAAKTKYPPEVVTGEPLGNRCKGLVLTTTEPNPTTEMTAMVTLDELTTPLFNARCKEAKQIVAGAVGFDLREANNGGTTVPIRTAMALFNLK